MPLTSRLPVHDPAAHTHVEADVTDLAHIDKLSQLITFLDPAVTILADGAVLYGSWETLSPVFVENNGFAKVQLYAEVNDNDNAHCEVNIYLRKTGSAKAVNDLTLRCSAHQASQSGMGGGNSLPGGDTNECWIELDDNGDFDYYAERIGAPDSDIVHIELVAHAI